MTFEEACAVAMKHFAENWDDKGLLPAAEFSDGWIFIGDSGDDRVRYGKCPLIIYLDGKTEISAFPFEKQDEFLERAHARAVPEEYRLVS